MADRMQELPMDKPTRLRNTTCVYCGRLFDEERKRTKEHVIARRFVPHVSFGRQWNLIVNACSKCNGVKADLENDVSAISMQPDAFGQSPTDDSAYLANAKSKGQGAISRRTRKPVVDSQEAIQVKGQLMPGLSISFRSIGPPQIPQDRAFMLAHFQMTAFFYWITYQGGSRQGGFWPGSFAPIALVGRGDWGNDQVVGFHELISEWPHRLHVICADVYFKAFIRRSPREDQPLWAWALEWNRNYRVIGFFGDATAAQEAFDELPVLKMKTIESGVDPKKGRFVTRYREEVPLPEERDHLFEYDSANR
jgi:hypothetical protein